jgi:hypothetical protein
MLQWDTNFTNDANCTNCLICRNRPDKQPLLHHIVSFYSRQICNIKKLSYEHHRQYI